MPSSLLPFASHLIPFALLGHYGEPIQLATLQDDSIDESSGLACSYTFPGKFWTINDSGGKPRLYLIGQDGKTHAKFKVDARNRDWEDLCSYRLDGQSYIAIADTGDNNHVHPHVFLHILKEPTEPTKGKLSIHLTFQVSYPDGPVDCEALGFDAKLRKFYLATKVRGFLASIYVIPIDTHIKKVEAKPVGQIPGLLFTAMDISPDGHRAILLTYVDALEYTRVPGTSWETAFQGKPEPVSMPVRAQGETICYGSKGESLYLTSEKPQQPFWKVPRSKNPAPK